MKSIYLDEQQYEDFVHQLGNLEKIIEELHNQGIITLLDEIRTDYKELQQAILDNKKNIAHVESLCVNGILDASNLEDHEQIAKKLFELRDGLKRVGESSTSQEVSLREKKAPLEKASLHIARLESVLGTLQNLKKDMLSLEEGTE